MKLFKVLVVLFAFAINIFFAFEGIGLMSRIYHWNLLAIDMLALLESLALTYLTSQALENDNE